MDNGTVGRWCVMWPDSPNKDCPRCVHNRLGPDDNCYLCDGDGIVAWNVYADEPEEQYDTIKEWRGLA